MKHNIQDSLTSAQIEKELMKYRVRVTKRYKEGDALGELCRSFRLDISSILFLLRKSRLKKKKLYTVYENQKDKDNNKQDFITKKDKHFLEKFFPSDGSPNLAGGYYWHWKEKYKKQQEKKNKCKHNIRHIRCSLCNKILKDASNIPIDDVITYKTKKKVDIQL